VELGQDLRCVLDPVAGRLERRSRDARRDQRRHHRPERPRPSLYRGDIPPACRGARPVPGAAKRKLAARRGAVMSTSPGLLSPGVAVPAVQQGGEERGAGPGPAGPAGGTGSARRTATPGRPPALRGPGRDLRVGLGRSGDREGDGRAVRARTAEADPGADRVATARAAAGRVAPRDLAARARGQVLADPVAVGPGEGESDARARDGGPRVEDRGGDGNDRALGVRRAWDRQVDGQARRARLGTDRRDLDHAGRVPRRGTAVRVDPTDLAGARVASGVEPVARLAQIVRAGQALAAVSDARVAVLARVARAVPAHRWTGAAVGRTALAGLVGIAGGVPAARRASAAIVRTGPAVLAAVARAVAA